MLATILICSLLHSITAAPVDAYGVTWKSPSVNAFGAMPVGNGRTSANVYVEASTCDLVLTLGLADALDENSNLLKLGRLRIRGKPSFCGSANFTQQLTLSTGTISIRSSGGAGADVWVDANSSAARVSLLAASTGSSYVAVLENWRLNRTVDVTHFGNGWAGSSGSFCNATDGNFATRVYTYPDELLDSTRVQLNSSHPALVAWAHRNDAGRADYFGETMRAQGLGALVGEPGIFDPLTNRTFGAAMMGVGPTASQIVQVNATALRFTSANPTTSSPTSPIFRERAELSVVVHSSQAKTRARFEEGLRQRMKRAAATPLAAQRNAHETYWSDFFNRSWIRLGGSILKDTESDGGLPPSAAAAVLRVQRGHHDAAREAKLGGPDLRRVRLDAAAARGAASSAALFTRYNRTVGDQRALLRNASWPRNGESPGSCGAAPFPAAECIANAEVLCRATPHCVAFALSTRWGGGMYPQTYSNGVTAAAANADWTFFDASGDQPTPQPPPQPPISSTFAVTRQATLMRYLDAISSGRIGGGDLNEQYVALKYNGGILTSELEGNEDSRAWGPGQWWQNVRLPYYAMLRSGDVDLFRPLLRWYLALLPMAKKRAGIWYPNASQVTPGAPVTGAWFIETMTQFGTFIASEKGYHCPLVRNTTWPVWWGGNSCINLHRVGSIELLMIGLDFWEHTLDEEEWSVSILPLATAVMNWVDSYFPRRGSNGMMDIFPTQALEGFQCNVGLAVPIEEGVNGNCVNNDMPIVAGLHAVLPRLLLAGAENGVPDTCLAQWRKILAALPPLPMKALKNGTKSIEGFAAAQLPWAKNVHDVPGSETPQMYAVHPYRLASMMGSLGAKGVAAGRATLAFGGGDNGNTGWKQTPANAALLGLADIAMTEIVERATVSSAPMRFPAFLPSMQDMRPNEDHLSVMRIALQSMLLQHGDGARRHEIGLLPAWPCDKWSVDFKVHVPGKTIVVGRYEHTTRVLTMRIDPAGRRKDVAVLGCVNASSVVWGERGSGW